MKINTNFRHLSVGAALATLVLWLPSGLSAQEPAMQLHCPSVEESFRIFHANIVEHSFDARGSGCLRERLRAWREDVPRTERILSRLEELALTDPAWSVRDGATALIGFLGSTRHPDPMPGMVQRLIGLYGKTEDTAVRSAVVSGLRWAADRAPAVAFLKPLATQPRGEQDVPGLAESVVYILSYTEEGREALRQLYEADAVRDPMARFQLRRIAENDFRPLPITHGRPPPE